MGKQRLHIALGVILVLSLVLAGCAPAPAPAQPTATAQPAATEAPPAATTPPETITLSVATNRVGSQAKLLEDIARKFEQEHPGIKIDFSAPGQEYEHLMKLKMAAKDMPDVFATHGWAKIRYGEFLADLRDQPWAASIDPAIKPAVVDDAGKVYVLPMDQEKGGPVYNVDILKEYGVEVPKTWDELLAACETIKTKSGGKITCIHMGGADSWPVGQYYDFFSTPLAVSPQQNDAQALLDGSYDWSKYVVLSQNLLTLKEKGYLNKDVLTAKYSDSARAFAEGKVAFAFYGTFLCEEALKISRENNLQFIRPGQPVSIALKAYPGQIFPGKVQSVGWGNSQGQGVPSGDLPSIENPQQWIPLPNRFQVRVVMDDPAEVSLRVGATASLVIYTTPDYPLNPVTGFLQQLEAWFFYLR